MHTHTSECTCKNINAYFNDFQIEIVIDDALFTIMPSINNLYSIRMHLINIESEFGKPMFEYVSEKKLIQIMEKLLLNIIYF